MDIETKLLGFFSDEAEFHGESKMEKAKNFLRGIEGTLKGEEDAEWSFQIASAMAHRGFLLNISRSDGQRERAKDLLADLFESWAGTDAKQYFLNYFQELESGFQEEGRSFFSKNSYEIIKSLTKIANDLDSKGLHKEADYVDGLLKKSQDSLLVLSK